jgi:hypothetical protein
MSDVAEISPVRALRDGRDRLAMLERGVADLRREADARPGPAGRAARARLRQAEQDLEASRSILALAEGVAERAAHERTARQSEAAAKARATLADIYRLAGEFDQLMADGARVAGKISDLLDTLAPLASRAEFPHLLSRGVLTVAVRSSDLGPAMGLAPVHGSSARKLAEHVTVSIKPTFNDAIARLKNKEPVQ